MLGVDASVVRIIIESEGTEGETGREDSGGGRRGAMNESNYEQCPGYIEN